MADSATLTLLLQRVEAAEGADRELDAAICAALRYLPPDCREAWAIGWEGEWRPGPGNVYLLTSDGKSGASFKSAPLSASLDAALMLVERALPGWLREVHERNPGREGRDWLASVEPCDGEFRRGRGRYGKAKTPALALLAALLKALSSEAQPLGSAREAPEDGQPKPNPESEPPVERMPMGEGK